MNNREAIAIVDPFFSGSVFPIIAERLGYEPVLIQSSGEMEVPKPSVKPRHYIVHDGNIKETLSLCRKLGIKALFAGNENGVMLADRLSEELGLISNGSALSLARRHKGEMKKALQRKDVPCARFAELVSPSISDVKGWMTTAGLDFPVVLKPSMGFGTINVFTCFNDVDVTEALAALNSQKLSSFGIENSHVLAEEFLDGDEYVVDTLGNGEEIFVTDMWRYEKISINGSHNVYRFIDLLDPDSDISRKIMPVGIAAARALGVDHGPSHVEIKLTSRGPKIVEIGARIVGTHLAELAGMANGWQIEEAVVRAFLGERPRFQEPVYKMGKFAMSVDTFTTRSGLIKKVVGVEDIKKLPSFFKIYLSSAPGKMASRTTSLVTTPATIHLVHSDRGQIEHDETMCHKLFDLEVE